MIKKTCDQYLTHALDTLKSLSIKIVAQVVICEACCTWYCLCTVTSIHSIQKSTQNSQKLRNKLANGWQKIGGSKQRGIELITKKVWRKRRDKTFRLRSWLLLHVKQYKSCCWRTYFIKKCIYLFLHSDDDDHDEKAMYLLTYHQQTN